MKTAATIVLAAAAWAAPAYATPIIGGTKTTTSDFPAVVLVTINDTVCTGTLVQPDWVMTAAHCLDPDELKLSGQAEVTAATTVHQGTVDFMTDMGSAGSADQTFLDPGWNDEHFGKHDLALIHLAAPYTGVAPLVANFKASLAPVGITVTMVGFGTTSASQTATAGIEFQLTNQVSEPCGMFAVGAGATNDDADLLCFTQANMQGTCFGDSGGPLIAMIDGVQTMVGLTSFGDNDCVQYGAYTRTNAEVDFVQSMIPALCEDDACVDPAQTSGGCSTSGGGGWLAALGVALALAARYRRRSNTSSSPSTS